MLGIGLIVIAVALLGLIFMGRHRHRSRLYGAAKQTHLVSEVAPEPLGEVLDHAKDRIPGSERSSSPDLLGTWPSRHKRQTE